MSLSLKFAICLQVQQYEERSVLQPTVTKPIFAPFASYGCCFFSPGHKHCSGCCSIPEKAAA
jgi:hypothetical protein